MSHQGGRFRNQCRGDPGGGSVCIGEELGTNIEMNLDGKQEDANETEVEN